MDFDNSGSEMESSDGEESLTTPIQMPTEPDPGNINEMNNLEVENNENLELVLDSDYEYDDVGEIGDDSHGGARSRSPSLHQLLSSSPRRSRAMDVIRTPSPLTENHNSNQIVEASSSGVNREYQEEEDISPSRRDSFIGYRLSNLAQFLSQTVGRSSDYSNANARDTDNMDIGTDAESEIEIIEIEEPQRRSTASPEIVQIIDIAHPNEQILGNRTADLEVHRQRPLRSDRIRSQETEQNLDAEVINVEEGEETRRNNSGADDDGEDENNGPPQKMPRLDTSVRSDDDDGFNCQICYEPYTNSGGHRVCCLKCGHIYGKDCIERWIQSSKRCPSCNCKAMKKDIRILYVKNLKVTDTAELERLKAEIDQMKIEKNKIELRNAQLRCREELQSREVVRLQQQINAHKQMAAAGTLGAVAGPSTSSQGIALSQSASSNEHLRMPKLQLMKHLDIKEGQCRVGAYNEWMNLLVVSHSITNRLYPSGSFGIKKINALDMKPFQSFPIHSRALRDMSFCPLQTDLLLTVGLDKKAVLFNCNSNCAVQTFQAPTSLWSCCWNSVNQNIFYIGSVNGVVTSYDIRAPQEPICNLTVPSTERSGVARLKFVPPAYQSDSFNMSGLLIQKLSSVWFAEMLGGTAAQEPRYHQLPLEGPFLNVDFEAATRHVLVSSRPKTSGITRTGTSHVVCTLGKAYSTLEERDIFSCDVVQSFTGGFQESSILCRSAIFSPQQGQVYVAANGEGMKTVRIWDIGNAEQKSLVRIKEDAALDFVSGKINEANLLGIITDKSLDAYNVSVT